MSRKLHVCYFTPLESIHSIRWLDHFCRLGHEVYVYTGASTGIVKWTTGNHLITETGSEFQIKSFNDQIFPRSINHLLYQIPGVRSALELLISRINLLKSKKWIQAQINKVRPDIVHALWLGDNAYNAWLTGIHPFLITLWGSDIRKIATKSHSQQSRLKIALSGADAVTSDSDELLALSQLWGAKARRCYRIGVPGIDIEKFLHPATSDLLERLGLLDETQIILSVRAIRPLYRIHNIVEAFAYIYQKRQDVVLVILNYNVDSEYLKTIEKEIQRCGLEESIRLVEPLSYDQMPEIYARSRVMVSIPESDGMPQSVYEALAAGCPIVASDLSTYDGILENEITALRVSGCDPQEIAVAILRLLQSDTLRERIISNGRQVVKQRGDICREMAKMEQLYYDLSGKYG